MYSDFMTHPGKEWHVMTAAEALGALSGSSAGLSSSEAASRLAQRGPNELSERMRKSAVRMLAEQFLQTMVLILAAAALVSAALGKASETVAILGIVILFAVLGFIQEYRAERAMAALRKLGAPSVRVRRDGGVKEVPSRELVPGDIVLLEAGNAVPADVRWLECVNLRAQESALTGEAEPVEKSPEPLSSRELPLGDRDNMGYLGTSITYGRGSGVVTETGMATELGRIASLIQEVPQSKTPLQARLDQISRALAVAGAVSALLVMAVGVLRGEPLIDMFLTAVSVAVAVVPEGLPAVVTITLALGAQRLLRRRALIRKLPAVETLGSVTVVCSDKTGTLTENRMSVTVVDVASERLDFEETLRQRSPEVGLGECSSTAPEELLAPIVLTLAVGALCNDAVLEEEPGRGCYRAIGDPTEGAFVVAAARSGMRKPDLESIFPRIGEFPFDSGRKRMSTVHAVAPGSSLPAALEALRGTRTMVLVKGSVDGLVGISTHVWTASGSQPLTDSWRDRILEANASLARNGMRVLGAAFKPVESAGEGSVDEAESGLTFAGMVGLMDPPRPAAKEAVAKCRNAGIRPVMITGDHPLTAAAIAKELGIADDPVAVTGDELAAMDDAALLQHADSASVFARVSPEDKLRIVGALQKRGHVVAMTGDGINDSPALKKADIGVAMGITGTDVAKEASDMVLLDDNFSTIISAVEEGRTIFANILRFVKFSLGGNLAKVLIMLGAPLLGVNVALRPLQLLWLNLLTDGLLGLGLGLEPADAGIMRRPPRPPGAPILDRIAGAHVSWVGAVTAAAALALGTLSGLFGGPGEEAWRTAVFAGLGFCQIGHGLGLRSTARSSFSFRSNPAMAILAAVVAGLQILVLFVQPFRDFFGFTALPLPALGVTAAAGAVVFLLVRLEQKIRGRGQA
jgi:Ca2+-transporting ATPase